MSELPIILLLFVNFILCCAEKTENSQFSSFDDSSTLSSLREHSQTNANNAFFKDLQSQLKELNGDYIPDTLSCGLTLATNLKLFCSNNQLTELSLWRVRLTSIPSSISMYSQSLETVAISAKLQKIDPSIGSLEKLANLNLQENSLSTLPVELASLASLTYINLGYNELETFPEVISSLTRMNRLFLYSNQLSTIPNWLTVLSNLEILDLASNYFSTFPFIKLPKLKTLTLEKNFLSTLPNEFSSLTSLELLDINVNPSLKASTELFKEMKSLTYLGVDQTLISGLKPSLMRVDCTLSCISSSSCSENPSCLCSSFFANSCPGRCGVNSQQLCVDCSSLVSQQQCSGDCSWCAGNKDGKNCYWCNLDKNKCSDSTGCSFCSGYLTSSECDSSSCHWCDYGYCVENENPCERVCSNLTRENCETKSNCIWCSSYDTCLDSTAQCLTCDRFSSSFCPPGCECSTDSDSNSTVLIIIVCVVCCVVLFGVCVCLFVLFVLKKKTLSTSNEMNTFSNSNTSLRFEDDIGINEPSEHPIISRYSECSVDSLFRISPPVLSFSSSGSPLKLCSPSTVAFEMTNICGIELVVDCFFVRGFKEKHEFVFSPSSFTIGKNEKLKISVELTMNCSATLSPSQSLICCGVSTKLQWCSLCGIQAQSELSPLLSCDDIELKRELGRGAFGKVYLGSFKGTEIAVKVYSSLTQEDNEKEANMFCKLHSPHIVTFFGISQSLNAMIIEYCKYGSVEGLFDRKEMTDLMRLLICSDCSLGMKYLHSNGIIHRDLKPDNLLVVSFSKDVNTVRAKISDFGTSRFVNQTMKMTESIGTPLYMAPEVFNNESYGKKSDVYSFGLTVWSILSKQTPYSELPNVQTILQKVNEGYRPQLNKNCPLNDLIERCWKTNPSDRPSFEEIVELLNRKI